MARSPRDFPCARVGRECPEAEGSRLVVILMGVAGVGKTTVGVRLAEALGWRFRDGDELHSLESVAKMAAGVPLTDEDRGPWLGRLRERVEQALAAGEGLVLACSALRRAYRERLVVDPGRVKLVLLWGSRELLAARLAARQGHFMPPELLDSQLATLEAPEDALVVEVSEAPDAVVARILSGLGLPRPG
jgi:gluconokinase